MSEKSTIATSEVNYFSVLHKDIEHLSHKNWIIDLIKVGFPVFRLRNGVILMKEMALGIMDTLNDQEKRNLIPVGFVLPDVRLDINYPAVTDSSYVLRQNAIGFRKTKLIQFASLDPDRIQEFKSGMKSSPRDYMYFTGIEEIKHAIDYKAGKALYAPSLKELSDSNYWATKHEYTALGEQVLLGGRRNPRSPSHVYNQRKLEEVIKHRQSQE